MRDNKCPCATALTITAHNIISQEYKWWSLSTKAIYHLRITYLRFVLIFFGRTICTNCIPTRQLSTWQLAPVPFPKWSTLTLISFPPKCYYQLLYTGRPADICEHEPCVNGGICSRSEEGFKCTCPLGYEGLNCETSKCISVILLFMCLIS